ncbi:MAG: DNA helicase UvrD, partial [Verrucomicrobia bacterium]
MMEQGVLRTVVPIDFRKELNDEQYRAVTSPLGPALVLAGAGSGKTRTLTYRVAWLLSQGVQPWEILLLTFTNKAAKEMLHRVEELTGIPAYQFWGGTFHHMGQRILRSHGERIGLGKNFNILDAGEADSLLNEVVRDKDPYFLKNKDNPKVRVVGEIISYARNTCQTVKEVIEKHYPYFEHLIELIPEFYKLYQERKLKQQVLDYDDLLEGLLKLLRENPDVAEMYQSRFKCVLVDEYQDTNKIQSSIIEMLAKDHQVMAVGDDAQCIYTWRGADFENIMFFPQRHPGSQIYKIETNYRSTPDILEFANAVLEGQTEGEGYKKKLKAVRGRKQKPYFVTTMDTKHQAQFVLRRIQGALADGYQYSDIAVLYRAHFHAMDLQMELSRCAIPYQITSGVRFFEQAHVRDFVAQLRFASNPLDVSAFCRIVCLMPKVGEKTAAKILEVANQVAVKENITVFKALEKEVVLKKVPEVAREAWIDFVYTLQDLAEGINILSPAESVKLAIEGWYGDYLKNLYTNWRSRQDDLESLEGFATRYDTMPDLLAQLVLLNSETSDRSVEIGENSVRLTTIHQAKGLEFPVVFIIG